MNYQNIITIEPGKRGGKPCIRGMRITVYDVLEYLASGMSQQEVADHLGVAKETIARWETGAIQSRAMDNLLRQVFKVSVVPDGALQERFRVGDLLLATEVVDTQGNHWPATWPEKLPPGEWHPPLHRGRLLAGDPALLRNVTYGADELFAVPA